MLTLPRTFICFCIVGASSAIVDISTLFVLVEFVHMPVLPDATIALLIASVNGYVLNKRFTYNDSSQKVATQYISFLLVSLVGLVLTLVLLSVFIQWLGLHYLVAKVITIVIVTFWNFTINTLFVFTST